MAAPLWRIRNVANVPDVEHVLNPQEADAGSRSRHPGLVTISSSKQFSGMAADIPAAFFAYLFLFHCWTFARFLTAATKSARPARLPTTLRSLVH
jgi:hypothetical protein